MLKSASDFDSDYKWLMSSKYVFLPNLSKLLILFSSSFVQIIENKLTCIHYQKKIESESFFDFLSRVEWLWVSNFCLRSRGKVEVSLGPSEAGIDCWHQKILWKNNFSMSYCKMSWEKWFSHSEFRNNIFFFLDYKENKRNA